VATQILCAESTKTIARVLFLLVKGQDRKTFTTARLLFLLTIFPVAAIAMGVLMEVGR
jgi:hypothetical protein